MKSSVVIYFLAFTLVDSKLFDYGLNDINHSTLNKESEYSISDIINRHRSLTDVAREDIKTFQNPKYDTSCIKKSLEPILSKCLKNSIDSIDSNLRVETAAKLSICEFEAAKITYPVECYPKTYYFGNDEDSIDYQECILGLEKSPQWWTTYSGNYRAIGDICFQESLPYEKDEILNLFLNVTEVYEQILQDLNANVEMSSKFKETSLNSFEELQKFMNQVLEKLEKDTNESKHEFEMKLKDMNSVLEDTSKLAKVFSNDTTGMTDIVLNQMSDLSSKWDGFFTQYNSDDFLNELLGMKQIFVQELETRDLQINNLMNSYSDKLESLYQSSYENNELSEKIGEGLRKSLKDTNELKDVLKQTENSVTISSEFAQNLLESFKDLDQMNIGEILNVSEQELLLVFQRITDELNQEMNKIQTQTRKLDNELDILVGKIDIATGSLVKINDILTNNVIMKSFIFLASTSKVLSRRVSLTLLGGLTYYFFLRYWMRLVTRKPGFLVILLCSTLCGLFVGDSIINVIQRFNRIEINSSPIVYHDVN
ncbi:Nuclear fusion protein [Wickerhamomyces ciferrii]|uniref:Nuclear fusion protein KAR5 n=1 Tax=Wickerhamomyces ciferrii (strain ATCC 14091 / BCRC 22168 / CBS 111 / JCM 3599 / NBRC 0793 / NRRL Y-1031 F-60-10) TaxID=1206466 RepID=K0KXC5_WICCF|nr:Nuclear fusion protein [Wickerhamomyces ciferrii]CCH46687.1 Nuclear fusion protein [Wickerhamomyces ciferrii]